VGRVAVLDFFRSPDGRSPPISAGSSGLVDERSSNRRGYSDFDHVHVVEFPLRVNCPVPGDRLAEDAIPESRVDPVSRRWKPGDHRHDTGSPQVSAGCPKAGSLSILTLSARFGTVDRGYRANAAHPKTPLREMFGTCFRSSVHISRSHRAGEPRFPRPRSTFARLPVARSGGHCDRYRLELYSIPLRNPFPPVRVVTHATYIPGRRVWHPSYRREILSRSG